MKEADDWNEIVQRIATECASRREDFKVLLCTPLRIDHDNPWMDYEGLKMSRLIQEAANPIPVQFKNLLSIGMYPFLKVDDFREGAIRVLGECDLAFLPLTYEETYHTMVLKQLAGELGTILF